MLSRLHSKLGTAGFIISIIALVAALGGGAYAASGGLTGKQKKEVEKIAKKSAGKPGAPGAAGPAGPAGAKGDTGASGGEGKQGPKGEKGDKGEEGAEGPEGSPWTLGGVLPNVATETGAWVLNSAAASTAAYVAVSFPIKLKGSIPNPKVHYVKSGETGIAGCSGTADAPTAAEATFCIYEGAETEPEGANFASSFVPSFNESGAGSAGAVLKFKEVGAGALLYGSWAVGGS